VDEKVSPDFSLPRSNTLAHTVKNVSGIAAAATSSRPFAPEGTAVPGEAVFRVPAARDERAHTLADEGSRSLYPDGDHLARDLQARDVGGAGRRRVSPLSLQQVRIVDPRGGHANQHVAACGRGTGRRAGRSTSGAPGR